MLESRRLILQVLIISGLGLLVGWAFSHYARASDNAIGDGKYEFDSPLETSLPVQARMAETDRLALIIGVSKFSQPSAYLGVLQRKFEHQGLKVLVVFSPESPKSHTLLADAIGVPWIVDTDGEHQRLLRSALTHRHDAVLISDKNYKVKFQALAAPDSDLLRQLVEKYLIGEITYSSSTLLSEGLVGKRIEGIQCRKKNLPPSKGIFVVFPPGCSSCELNSYKQELQRAHQSTWGFSGGSDKWTLIFVNGLDSQAVANAEDIGFPVQDVCGIREDKLLDPYQTRKGPETVPILLKTGDDGVVKDVQDLSTVSNGGEK